MQNWRNLSQTYHQILLAPEAQSDWWSVGHGFDPLQGQHSFVEIDHEIFSTVILSLQLIQEGQ